MSEVEALNSNEALVMRWKTESTNKPTIKVNNHHLCGGMVYRPEKIADELLNVR